MGAYEEAFGSRRLKEKQASQDRVLMQKEEDDLNGSHVVELPLSFPSIRDDDSTFEPFGSRKQSQFPREEFARNRNEVLFNREAVRDPLVAVGTKFGDYYTCQDATPPPFQLVTKKFLETARALTPCDPEPTASAFAQWVYSLYGTGFGSEEDIERGNQAEKVVLEERRKLFRNMSSRFDPALLREVHDDWKLVHNGIQIAGAHVEWFSIPELSVGGEPMRASPDLLFVNQQLGRTLIVEIKNTRIAVPPNLWPNIWAQLWCYAQIDVARKAKKLAVVGEVWGNMWHKRGFPSVFLRASVQRDPRAPAYDRFFRELFQIYSGG